MKEHVSIKQQSSLLYLRSIYLLLILKVVVLPSHLFSACKPSNLRAYLAKRTKYGTKSLKSLQPHIWYSLLQTIKSETNKDKFNKYINQWFSPKYKCELCQFLNK